MHKDRIFPKNLLENKEMDIKNGVINIQTAGYNGAHTVDGIVNHSGYWVSTLWGSKIADFETT